MLGEADNAYLFTVNGGKAQRVPVQTGVDAGDLIAVTGALKDGDVVVVSGNYELSDGMVVRVAP